MPSNACCGQCRSREKKERVGELGEGARNDGGRMECMRNGVWVRWVRCVGKDGGDVGVAAKAETMMLLTMMIGEHAYACV